MAKKKTETVSDKLDAALEAVEAVKVAIVKSKAHDLPRYEGLLEMATQALSKAKVQA